LLAQVVLLREILASSQGNELVLGFALCLWLCLTGVASVLGARFARSPATSVERLAFLLAISPLILLGSLAATALAATNGLGQEPGLAAVMLASSVALLPACVLAGVTFAWAAAAIGVEQRAVSVYVSETIGAAVAGVLFHFLLAEQLQAAWVLFLAGVPAAAAGAALGWPHWRAMALAAMSVLVAMLLSPFVQGSLTAARFPDQRVLALEPSRYGLLAVIERDQQRSFFHDGVLLFTNQDQELAEERTHLPMLLHPHPRRVLMVGGGLGGGLSQVLAHRPEEIDYAELDPAMLALARVYAGEDTMTALQDGRVHAASEDGRALLRAAVGRYDVILLNLPVAQNALVARFSTRECFTEARRALARGGILSLVTPGSDTYLDVAARLRHASLLATLKEVFPVVGVAPGAATVFWASERPVQAKPTVLAGRLGERGIHPRRVGLVWLFDRLLPFHVQDYLRSLARVPRFENRDLRPIVYLFGLIERLERISPALGGRMLSLVRRAWVGWLWGGAVLLVVVGALAFRRSRQAPAFAAGAAGGAGMALEIVLLLAYQSFAGHLYHALGGMLAGFMIGMAAGASMARKLAPERRALAWACAAGALISVLLMGALAVAARWPQASTSLMLLGVLLAGASTGAIYPLTVAAAARRHAAARMYAWDLAGAAGAALLVSLLAVPLLGLFSVAAMAGGLYAVAALANRGCAAAT